MVDTPRLTTGIPSYYLFAVLHSHNALKMITCCGYPTSWNKGQVYAHKEHVSSLQKAIFL